MLTRYERPVTTATIQRATEWPLPLALSKRKEPLENANHVRNAIARFNQIKIVTDDERDAAWKRIETAAKKYSVGINEKSRREIGKS